MILTLQTSTFSVYGGIPTYNRLVCRVLNGLRGESERIVLLGTDRPADLAAPAAELPALRLEAFARNRQAFVRRILGLAMREQIDMVIVGHVNYAPLGWLLRRLQPDLRYGVMMYGIEVWERLSHLRRMALQQADFSVSISEYTKQKAIEANGRAGKRAYLLPNALEWKQNVGGLPPAELKLPAGTRLLTVCRLDSSEQYKGVDQVIEALPAVAAQVPDVQFLIVGDGSDSTRLKELAHWVGVAGRVHFLGFVETAALRAYYQTCDLFVMPSAREGFGFVFLEAMQYEKAVVAADAGGSPEVVQDETTGLLVRYGNVPQLAQALTRLCLDPKLRAQLGQAGYRRLQEKFTFPQFESTLTDILTEELPTAALYRSRRRLAFRPAGLS